MPACEGLVDVSTGRGAAPKRKLIGATVQRASVVEQVTTHLREAILDGTFAPGFRLRQEPIAADLGVSRTPVREAFRSLASEGLVNLGNGTADVVALTDQDIVDYYEIREAVDGLASSLAAQRHTRQDLVQLKKASDGMTAALTPFRPSQWLRWHAAFHLGILRASGNSRMDQLEILVKVSALMMFPRVAGHDERMLEATNEHIAILEAIERGDAEGAERAARDHIRAATHAWVSDVETASSALS